MSDFKTHQFERRDHDQSKSNQGKPTIDIASTTTTDRSHSKYCNLKYCHRFLRSSLLVAVFMILSNTATTQLAFAQSADQNNSHSTSHCECCEKETGRCKNCGCESCQSEQTKYGWQLGNNSTIDRKPIREVRSIPHFSNIPYVNRLFTNIRPLNRNSRSTSGQDHEKFVRQLFDKIDRGLTKEQAVTILAERFHALEDRAHENPQVQADVQSLQQERSGLEQNIASKNRSPGQPNGVVVQIQKQLSPIKTRQERSEQMLRVMEARIAEVQQAIQHLDRRLEFQAHKAASNSTANLPTNLPPTTIQVPSPSDEHSNQPLPVQVIVPGHNTWPVQNQPSYINKVRDRANGLPARTPHASQTLPTTNRELYLPTPPLNSDAPLPTSNPNLVEQLKKRILELEAQIESTSKLAPVQKANYEEPVLATPEFDRSKDKTEPYTQPLSPGTVTPEPLQPKATSRDLLAPSNPLQAADFSTFVPRSNQPESRKRLNWFTETYYVGDLIPYSAAGGNGSLDLEDFAKQFSNILIAYLQKEIEPHSWTDSELAKVRFLPHTLSLRITQTHSNHQEIAALLNRLRSHKPK